MGCTGSKIFSLLPAVALCFLSFVQILWVAEATACFTKCPNADVTVYAKIKEDIPFVCRAAESTYSFLSKAGFNKLIPIEIYVVEELKVIPFWDSYFGMYEERLKRVTVLSHNSCRKHYKGSCFCGLRFCRNLHSSFVVHEIAHAIAHANLNTKNHNIAAQEYIAYTTQLTLLPDDLREKILTRMNNKGFGHEREITSLFYELNPFVFAVKAYRHFIRPENGKIFYRKLITGQCILDRRD